ncbi:transposable element Tcb2 transposase [Trichonephila clavipes]|nr:transposable element Tcb2 transposase [Trichonephila clavipes]
MWYKDDIFEPYVRLFTGTFDFILDDSANKSSRAPYNIASYRAHIFTNYWEVMIFYRMDWPFRSPDLIPMQHAWQTLGRVIATCNVIRRTAQILQNEVLKEEYYQPQEFLNPFISSKKSRCVACISVMGDHFCY